jgi:ABC-type multidrug transport system ATPase subunit
MTTAIQAEGLVKQFGATRALDGVDLDVPAGTVLGLLGPNGSGKTTTVRILTTLLRPDAGRAIVAGYDLSRRPMAARAQIGLTGQYAAVDEPLTGRENLELIGSLLELPRPLRRDRAAELLELVGLDDAADRLVRTYSGGMRRRLDLAASLSAGPGCCSWTSRPPGWTRAAASACGARSASWSPTAPPSCSPPSTWRRPTSSPTGSWCSTLAG